MAGRIMAEAEASAQVELDSGKRVKVKSAHMMLKFDKPAPAALLSDAAALSQTIELELAYECAPDEEFGFGDLAKDYFSANANTTEQVAALLRLHEAPHYFRRGSAKGRFRKAPAEIVQQALIAIEKKQQQQAEILMNHKKKCEYPIVICGDMNNSAYSYVYRSIKGSLNDCFEEAGSGFGQTYNFKYYPARIDYIFADKIMKVKNFTSFPEFINSDHSPVLTRLEMD